MCSLAFIHSSDDSYEKYSGDFFNPESGLSYERFSGFVTDIKDTISKSGKKMLRLELDVYKGKPMVFFIMDWDEMYKQLKTIEVDKPIAIAIYIQINNCHKVSEVNLFGKIYFNNLHHLIQHERLP
jgi:hypothetical protein